MVWPEKGEKWLEERKKGKRTPYRAAGLFLDGNRLTAAEWGTGGLHLDKDMKWDGAEGFCLPMNRMDFFCMEGKTYGEVFSGFLRGMAEEIRNGKQDIPLVLGVYCPEREAWRRGMKEYLELLENAFETENTDVFPVLVSLPELCGAYMGQAQKAACVSVERDCTDFAIMENGEISRHLTVFFGWREGQKISAPLSLRLNDYKNNSTEEWEEKHFPSWEEGFAEIWKEVRACMGMPCMDTFVLCPDAVWETLERVISGDMPERVFRIAEPAACIAEWVGRKLDRPDRQEKKRTPHPAAKKAVGKEDVWRL